jgi:hypothetical protein
MKIFQRRNSFLHHPHHGAQKLRRTTLPRFCRKLICSSVLYDKLKSLGFTGFAGCWIFIDAINMGIAESVISLERTFISGDAAVSAFRFERT